MKSSQCLRFLRPYACQPLRAQAHNAAYLRLYTLSLEQQTQCRRRCQAPAQVLGYATSSKKVEELSEGSSPAEDRSALVNARIRQLSEADALRYPRIEHDTKPMRIPVFRETFQHVTEDSPAAEEVVLHGRLQSVRRAGSKLVFLDICGEFESVQGMCNLRRLSEGGISPEQFRELSRLLNRGDLVSVTGRAIRTAAGELTIEATQLPKLLSPSLVPLPTKLVDEDTKIQHRHMDMLVNRQTADVLLMRAHIIRHMRDFLHGRGFLEFQTPILAEHAGGAVARPFATAATEFPSRGLALRIAPELWLKRLVVGGVDRVFELGPAFRNEGIDATHNPEFTMCEFYMAYADLPSLLAETEALVAGMARHCQDLIATKLASLPPIHLDAYSRPFKQLEFIPALEAALGFGLPDLATEEAMDGVLAQLEAHSVDLGADFHPTSLPKLLDRLAGIYLEPESASAPLFITHHPACMSPLSKSFVCPRTGQAVSARAELFVAGRELANMYEEENDPFAQRRKLVEQRQRARQPPRAAAGDEGLEHHDDADGEEGSLDVDESYIAALESGLPPTGGWGCGVERLVMLFSGAKRISDCLSFGSLRNVVGLSAGGKKDA